MSNAYTVLWTHDRCQWIKQCGDEGQEIRVMFGGAHQSAPSLKRVGIVSGDQVFAVRVLRGQLYIIARLIAGEFISLSDYVVKHLGLPVDDTSGLHEYQLIEFVEKSFSTLGHRKPYGCNIEVLLATNGSEIRFDRVVPATILENLTFCSKKSRLKLKHLHDGKLTSSVSLQGNVRRLCPESAHDFNILIEPIDTRSLMDEGREERIFDQANE